MVQEIGETVEAMVSDDEKEIERILNGYKKDHYWIVIHHKPTKKRLSTGEMIIRKVIKPYNSKPEPMLGTIVLEVLNGEVVDEQINMHDAPIDWWAINGYLGNETTPMTQKRKDIGDAFIYNV